MSQTQFVFLNEVDVPNREKLQAALDALNFDLQLDPEFTPFEDEGFSPCILNGEENIGFEIYYEPAADLLEDDDDEEFHKIVGAKDYAISLCWGGSFKDCMATLMVSIALSKEFGATVSYQGETVESIEGMLAGIEDCAKEIAKSS